MGFSFFVSHLGAQSIDFQLDLELHLPGVMVERYFAYSHGGPPESLRGHKADN